MVEPVEMAAAVVAAVMKGGTSSVSPRSMPCHALCHHSPHFKLPLVTA
jgi:hypothetical protein